MTELTVTIKGSEQTYKQKFLLYEEFTWSEYDETILNCIKEAQSNATFEEVEDIKVRAMIQIK